MNNNDFITAIQSGAGEEAALQFIAFGGDVNAPLGSTGQTPIHLAVEAENAAMIRALFNLGVDIDARDDAGLTPLHHAVELDINSAGQLGWAEGDYLRNLKFPMTELLLSLGADPGIRTPAGLTPREIAASSGADTLRKYDEAVERAQKIGG